MIRGKLDVSGYDSNERVLLNDGRSLIHYMLPKIAKKETLKSPNNPVTIFKASDSSFRLHKDPIVYRLKAKIKGKSVDFRMSKERGIGRLENKTERQDFLKNNKFLVIDNSDLPKYIKYYEMEGKI